MNKPKIWLSAPHIGNKELHYINEAFASNWVAPIGPNVDNFEKDLSNYHHRTHVAALSTGTSALHLSLILLDVKPGDYVFCQSITFAASANPINYLNAIPVFIDSEMDSWNIDPILLDQALEDFKKNKKLPKAIIVVDLYGMPAKYNEIIKVANKYQVPIIEDAAEAIGSTYFKKLCGTHTELGILSFNGNKLITTSGGGALLSFNKNHIEKAKFLATQARDPYPHYEHSHTGYNYRMSNILAGIGRGQLEVLNDRIRARRNNFTRYKNLFFKINSKGYNIKFQEEFEGAISNYWLTCILINPVENKGIDREKVRLALEQENIESRPIWKPMHQQPIFKNSITYLNGNADYLFKNGLCLPSGSNLTENEFNRIEDTLNNIFN